MTVENFFEAIIDTEVILLDDDYAYTTDFLGNYKLIVNSLIGTEPMEVEDFKNFKDKEINVISTVDDVIILSL